MASLSPAHVAVIAGIVALAPLFPLRVAGAQPIDPRFENQEEAVHFTFARYRNAVLTRDGAAAWATVDSNTHAYYQRLIDQIKYGSQEELQQLSYTDLTIILSSRQFIDRDSLAGMDGRAVFEHAVRRGWTDRDLVTAGVGPVEFRDDVAYGRMTSRNLHTPFHWVFRFQKGRWHLDLAAQMEVIDQLSQAMLADEGLSPADLAYAMLVRGVGADAVSPDIWQPPLQRPE
jgi:hypothetical protein